MDNKKRMRKPVVCNVCRRRKIRCDKAKPACTACKKANMSHVCSYDERPAFSHLEIDPPIHTARPLNRQHQQSQQSQQHQQGLVQQQQQFQQQLQQRQHAQLQFQGQVAARYGQPGQPLTGASLSGSPESLPPQPSHTPYFVYPPAALPSLNPSLALSESQHQHQPVPQWAPLQAQQQQQQQQQVPMLVPQSYNPQQELQSEFDVLNKRIVQVQGAMRQHGVQPVPSQSPVEESGSSTNAVPSLQTRPSLPQLHHQPQLLPSRLPSLKSDDNIDPTFFDADEVIRLQNFNIPESKLFKFQSNGLFEASSFIKKDVYQALYHFNLLEYGKDEPESLIKKHTEHFSKMIDSPDYAIEEYMKYQKGTLAELAKQVERKLPTKKVTWILLDLFHDVVGVILPIFNKTEFQDMLSTIIGKREETDSRTKIYFRPEENSYLITLVHLVLALRLTHFALTSIRNPTDYQRNLLKASNASNEYDRFIKTLSSMADNLTQQNTLSNLKLTLLKVLYTKANFDGLDEGIDTTPASLATLAISANLNDLSTASNDFTPKQSWALVYFNYCHSCAHRGLPMLLTENYFFTGLTEKNYFMEDIAQANNEQLQIFSSVEKILNKLNSFSSVLTLTALDELLKDYDDKLIKLQGHWKDFKTNRLSVYRKVVYTFNNFTHKQIKISAISLILLHYEMIGMKVNAPRYKAYLNDLCNLYVETFDEMYDIYTNVGDYFQSGFEFMVFSGFLPQLERLLGLVSAFVHRAMYHKKPMPSLVKFYLNLIDYFETANDLTRYFPVWRCINRLKLALHLWQKHTKGEIDLYKTTFEHENEVIDFKSMPGQHETFDDDTWAILDKNFDRLNDKYSDTKYHTMTTVEELLGSIDFEAPRFNSSYFYSG